MENVIPVYIVGAQGVGKKTLQQFFNSQGKYIRINGENGIIYNLETQIFQNTQKYINQQALCVIFVYSIIDKQSFDEVQRLSGQFNAKVKILIGTHRDQAQNRKVQYDVAQKLVAELQGIWGECGLNDDRNKNQLKEQIINRISFFLVTQKESEDANFLNKTKDEQQVQGKPNSVDIKHQQNSLNQYPTNQTEKKNDSYIKQEIDSNDIQQDQKQSATEQIIRPEQDSDLDTDQSEIFAGRSRIQAMFIPRTIKLSDQETYYTISGDLIKELDTNNLKPIRKEMLNRWNDMVKNQFIESQKFKIKLQQEENSNSQTNNKTSFQNSELNHSQNNTISSFMLGNTINQPESLNITGHAINRSQFLNDIFNGNDCDFILNLQIKDKEVQLGVRYTDNAYQLAKDFCATQHLTQQEINMISVIILDNIQKRMTENISQTKGIITQKGDQQMLNMSLTRNDENKNKKKGRKLIFQLELEINGQVYIIPFKEGDTPEKLSARICETMELDTEQYEQHFIQKIRTSYNQYQKHHQLVD